MSAEDPYRYVHDLLVEQFNVPPGDVQPHALLADDLGIDSIDAVDLIGHMREVTGERMTPDHFKTVRTVQDIVDIVNSHVTD